MLSSFFTATTLESGNVPLKTEPKPPPPSLSEKFLVAFCKSLYANAINDPPTEVLAPASLFLRLITTIRT
ncbi:hypothetical protein A2U01_0093777, partial [Trifolium medium]|nr:hypothetical protein [Trifolium medium]